MSDKTQHSHRRYSVATHPETKSRLDLINRMALLDEPERELTFPKDGGIDPKFNDLITKLNQALSRSNPETQDLEVWSFDIDLTLQMPDDEPGSKGTIRVTQLRHRHYSRRKTA